MSLFKRIYRPSFAVCRFCAVAAQPRSSVHAADVAESFDPPSSTVTIDPALAGTPLPEPLLDNAVSKVYSEKVTSLVDQIAGLTLLEVADLNELLKSKLGLPDVAMMSPVSAAAGPAAAASSNANSSDEAAPKEPATEKLVYNVKLVKFDPDNKVKLIKEIKSLIEGMNLVQAKKFVEGVPQMIRSDIPKGNAEELKKKIEAAGGSVEIE